MSFRLKIYVNHHYGISLFVFLRGLFGETPAPTLVYLSGWCMMFDAVRGKPKKNAMEVGDWAPKKHDEAGPWDLVLGRVHLLVNGDGSNDWPKKER